MEKKYTIQDFLEIKSAGGADFSPDGQQLVFLSNWTGVTQMYRVPTTGGEPRQLTDYQDRIEFASFSPTANHIWFGKSEGGNEHTQLYLYDLDKNSVQALTNNPDVIYRAGGWSLDGRYLGYASNERSEKDFDAYVMDLESGESKLIFQNEGWSAFMGFSPLGTMAVVKKVHTGVNDDLYLINLASGEVKLLTPHEGDAHHYSPRWLPDESGFYFVTDEDSDVDRVLFFDLSTNQTRIAHSPNWEVQSFNISRDGNWLSLIINEDGYSKLTVYEAESFTPLANQTMPVGDMGNGRWSNDGSQMALGVDSTTKNNDIWVWSREENRYWQVTHSPSRVPESEFVEAELVHFKAADGLEIPAFIYKPRDTHKAVPAIINIHGGPEGQHQPNFNPLIQYFVYHGFAVVAPNVRGSSGYGKHYMALDNGRKRMDAVEDMRALYDYLRSRGDIDMAKIALMGGSYGGYMTLAGLAFQPELWAAGVDIVGISNMVTFLENTSIWRRGLREAEYGYLATDREFLETISPLNFVDQIKAPLMIIHGKNDPRVPLSEAEQMHTKLSERGIKTELLVYEDEGHGLAKLKNRLDAYPKVVDFLDEVLKRGQN